MPFTVLAMLDVATNKTGLQERIETAEQQAQVPSAISASYFQVLSGISM